MTTRHYSKKIGGQLLILGLVALMSCLDEWEEEPLPANPCRPDFKFGYTEKVSYYPGDKVKVFMQAKSEVVACRLDIYSLDGDLAFSSKASLRVQIERDNPSMNGFGFTYASEIIIPQDLASGIYLIENSIPIVVKTMLSVDMLVVYPSNTANAYELSGGKSYIPRLLKDQVPFHFTAP